MSRQHTIKIHLLTWFLLPFKDTDEVDWLGYRFLCFSYWVKRRKKKKTLIEGFKIKPIK